MPLHPPGLWPFHSSFGGVPWCFWRIESPAPPALWYPLSRRSLSSIGAVRLGRGVHAFQRKRYAPVLGRGLGSPPSAQTFEILFVFCSKTFSFFFTLHLATTERTTSVWISSVSSGWSWGCHHSCTILPPKLIRCIHLASGPSIVHFVA